MYSRILSSGLDFISNKQYFELLGGWIKKSSPKMIIAIFPYQT